MDIYIYDSHITLPFLNSLVKHQRFALPKQETGMAMVKQCPPLAVPHKVPAFCFSCLTSMCAAQFWF